MKRVLIERWECLSGHLHTTDRAALACEQKSDEDFLLLSLAERPARRWPVRFLELDTRTARLLRESGCETVGDLVENRDKLRAMRGWGYRCDQSLDMAIGSNVDLDAPAEEMPGIWRPVRVAGDLRVRDVSISEYLSRWARSSGVGTIRELRSLLERSVPPGIGGITRAAWVASISDESLEPFLRKAKKRKRRLLRTGRLP